MKINFISYLDPFIHKGGGEQITSSLIKEGQKRGHQILFSFWNPRKNEYREDADFNILWDIYNCPELNDPIPEDILWKIVDQKPYIYGTGGYEDICILGTLPCNGNTDGITCNVPRDHRTFGEGGIYRAHPRTCLAAKRAKLLKTARLCILFSSLQRDMLEKVIGPINSFIAIPPVTGLERFYDMKLNRDIDLLSYGGHLEYKGFFNIMKMFPNREPVFIGGGPAALPQLYRYGRYAGKVPQEHMPEVLNRTKTFVHLPRWPEPFGITTLQALLCGCDVVENENSVVLQGKSKEQLVSEIKKWEDGSLIWDRIEASV